MFCKIIKFKPIYCKYLSTMESVQKITVNKYTLIYDKFIFIIVVFGLVTN